MTPLGFDGGTAGWRLLDGGTRFFMGAKLLLFRVDRHPNEA